MIPFEKLYTEFEHTNNVCQFYETYKTDNISTRFLLIRSLDRQNLKELIAQHSSSEAAGNIKTLTGQLYKSDITIEELLAYIESKRSDLISAREAELDGLPDVLSRIPVVDCGVRNDKIDDIVKKFVRNKAIKSYEGLEEELEASLLPKVRQYCLWSYYNQTSNDIIELFFLRHPKVIPTLRKIHDIDFFLKVGDKILPFDLKFTHISDSYFDLVSQGISSDAFSFDDYVITEEHPGELKRIRACYNTFKNAHKELGLPAASTLSKQELADYIDGFDDETLNQFLLECKYEHANYVPSTQEQLKTLEWWNYKYQGERLFCNNNRLFVFLSYRNKFIDGRELKGKTKEIGRKIKSLLDSLNESSIHEIHYHYDKEAGLTGDYTALSLSAIYSE